MNDANDLTYLIDNFEYARDPTQVREAVERIVRLIGGDPDLIDLEVSPVQDIEYHLARFMRTFVQRMLDGATGSGEMRPDVALGWRKRKSSGRPSIDLTERDVMISVTVARLESEIGGYGARGLATERAASQFGVSRRTVEAALTRYPTELWVDLPLK